MPATIRLLLVLFIVRTELGFSAVASENIERQFSVSQNSESRNVFANPAAFGFETALNGAELLGAFQYGFNHNTRDDLAFSLSYGALGFGVEHLVAAEGQFSRYGFALGIPLGTWLYLGGRYSFTSSDEAALNGVHSVDLGMQIRPSQYVALGFLATSINQPTVDNQLNPAQYLLGLSIRPLGSPALELSADLITSSVNFAKDFSYVGFVGVEPWQGIKVRAGYHQKYQFQAGLQIDLGHSSLISNVSGGVVQKPVVAGLQFSSKPYASVLNPGGPVKLEIESTLAEEPVASSLFMPGKSSVLEVLELLDKAQSDTRATGVIVRLDSFPLGLASAEEIFEALWKIREAGKTVDVFLKNAGIREYLIASAATTIHQEPTSELKFLGVRSEHYYFKGTLDKVGIEGEFLAKGEYKSAPEMFTRKQSSPLNHDTILAELKAAETEILSILTKSGRVDATKWRELLNRGLLSAEDAKELKLVDKLDYYPRAMEEIKKTRFVRNNLRERKSSLALLPKIAVIVAHGDILDRKVGALSLGGYSMVTPEKLEKNFKRALSDPRTEAILLRVSSPGGEIVASDAIASLVASARQKKPVYVSMGDVAASGGYFIAAPAERIFASPLTITGSIGVFLGKFSLAGLYKKIDLNKEILGYSPYPGLFSEDRPWTSPEKAILGRRLDQYYASFVKFVASTRHLSADATEAAAKGRVWLGKEALEKKLTDASGGFLDSVKALADRADLSQGRYELWVLEECRGLLDFDTPTGPLLQSAGIVPDSLMRSLRWAESLRESPFLYWSPASAGLETY